MYRLKNISAALLIIAALAIPVISGCSLLKSGSASTLAYQTIGTTEVAADLANRAYLEQVVLGKAPTNSTLKVETAFNDLKMGLLAASVAASGGTNAPVPALLLSKATDFTNTITSAVQGK